MNWCIRTAAKLTVLALPFAMGSTHAQSTERVSVATNGAEGNANSYSASISTDARFIAFLSDASNLVAGDTNGFSDVFVRDRVNATTERVSVATGGAQANFHSYSASISADGRCVAFMSDATNLVAGDTNGYPDVFVRDRTSGTTECVSVDSGGAQGNQPSQAPSISDDGRFVAFRSYAPNLVAGDTNGFPDVFVRDRQLATTERVSVSSGGAQANFESYSLAISGDGRFVAFASGASNLVAGDTNGYPDVFVRDRATATTERVSVATSGAEGNGDSSSLASLAISSDGRFVAFTSSATNLVAGDTNGWADVFVRDRVAGTTERMSVAWGGAQGNADSFAPAISADGRFVALQSTASSFVANDTNANYDVFVHYRLSGATVRASVDSNGAEGDDLSVFAALSADGRFVAFMSGATNLVPGDSNGCRDIFVRDRQSPPPNVYCTAGTSSNGCVASIGASANPSLSFADACDIAVTNVEGLKAGILFYGVDNAGFAPTPWASGSTSLLCVKHPTQRTPLQNSGGTFNACDGSFALDWNAYQAAHPLALGNPWNIGAKIYAQTWFRDALAVKSSNLSNALELTYVP